MEKKTKETYKREILNKYGLEKKGELSGYLFEPTPKSIKELCENLVNERHSSDDIKILNNFFKPNKGEAVLHAIGKIDTTKFKPVISFLKEDTKDPNPITLELISWLVNHNPRPLYKYLQSKDIGKEQIIILKKIDTGEEQKKTENKTPSNLNKKQKNIIIKSILITAMLLLGFCGKNFVDRNQLPNKQNEDCMIWNKTHYKEVPCNSANNRNILYNKIKLLNFKKKENVTLKDSFFDEETNQPLMWYNKTKDNKIEFFTSSGLHPVTGETLKAVTEYIIDKYVPKHSNNKDSFTD